MSANTKLVSGGAASTVTVRRLRVRGGNFKFRALRLDSGNYSWPSQAVTRKTRILDVNYNASNNELARRHPPPRHARRQSRPGPKPCRAARVSWEAPTPRPCPQVRTQTLVKAAVVQIDATPFRQVPIYFSLTALLCLLGARHPGCCLLPLA